MAAQPSILVVEDDSSDAYFLEKAFERVLANCFVHRVEHGEQAQAYVLGNGQYADRTQFPLPRVILLDLALPCMNGFEFLEWIKSHTIFRIIPVVIYSGAENPSDIRRAYALGANSFLRKHMSLHAVVETMRTFARYWLEDSGTPLVQ